jgi:UDP-N-acetylglucosamine 2-epimerase (non-hydrolysing)
MEGVGRALSELAQKHPRVLFLLPVHPNPRVRSALCPPLQGLANVVICAPLPYEVFLAAVQRAWFLISDSGGVQEEATAFGKPVLVLREETERPEGVRDGPLRLIGFDPARIVKESLRLLNQPSAYRKLSRASTVFGDGRAAPRIVRILEKQIPAILKQQAGQSRS